MKSSSKFYRIISEGCIINSALLVIMYLIGVTIDAGFIPTLGTVFGILGYSIILAFANLLFFSSKMKLFPRLLIHFFATAAVFYIMFVLLGGYKGNPGSVIVIFGLYLVIYAIVAAIVAVIRSILKAEENEKKEYKKVYGKRNDYKSQFGGKK